MVPFVRNVSFKKCQVYFEPHYHEVKAYRKLDFIFYLLLIAQHIKLFCLLKEVIYHILLSNKGSNKTFCFLLKIAT